MSKRAPKHTTRIRRFFESGHPEAVDQKALHIEITRLKPRGNEYVVQVFDTVRMDCICATIVMGSKCMTFKENTTYPLKLDFLKGMSIPAPLTVFDRE